MTILPTKKAVINLCCYFTSLHTKKSNGTLVFTWEKIPTFEKPGQFTQISSQLNLKVLNKHKFAQVEHLFLPKNSV